MDVRSFFKPKPKPAMDRIADILATIAQEKIEEMVSFEYDLGWNHDSKAVLTSGGRRLERSDYREVVDPLGEKIDMKKVSSRIKEIEASVKERQNEIAKIPRANRNEKNDAYCVLKRKIGYGEENVSWLKEVLKDIETWVPTNCYYGDSYNYNTKEHNTHKHDAVVEQALDDYKLFADDLNKMRHTPIRNIGIRTRIDADGSRTLEASWLIHHQRKILRHFTRQYQILPEFKFIGGVTLKSIREDEEKEEREKEAKKKALADKKAERERDPVYILTKQIDALNDEYKVVHRERQREINKLYPYGVKRTPEQEVEWRKMYDANTELYDEHYKRLEKMKKELSKAKKEAKAKAPK